MLTTPTISPTPSVFPALIANTRIDLGLIFAIVAVVVVWFALYRTSWGLKLRLVGHNAASPNMPASRRPSSWFRP